jgi:hypothetical protein
LADVTNLDFGDEEEPEGAEAVGETDCEGHEPELRLHTFLYDAEKKQLVRFESK